MGGNPNPPAIILRKRIHVIIRQSTASLAVNRNLPVVPFVQAISSAKPDAAIPGRQDGHNGSIGQSLLHRNRGDGKVPKAVEAIYGGHPNIAFAILEEPLDIIAREPVRLPECIRPSLVNMQESPVRGPNPQTAIAVPEQPDRRVLPHRAWEPIRVGFSVNETTDSTSCRDQECAVDVFDLKRRVRHRVEFWRTRLPSQQPNRPGRPKIAPAVLVLEEESAAETAVLSVALG